MAAQTYSNSVADPGQTSQYAPSSRSRDRQQQDSPKYAKDDKNGGELVDKEEEEKPDRLALLLAESKFTCAGLKNGYYADET